MFSRSAHGRRTRRRTEEEENEFKKDDHSRGIWPICGDAYMFGGGIGDGYGIGCMNGPGMYAPGGGGIIG